jgi:hypothetical protein
MHESGATQAMDPQNTFMLQHELKFNVFFSSGHLSIWLEISFRKESKASVM